MERNNPILSVDFKHYFDNVSEGVVNQGRLCIDKEAIQNGLIKKVGANKLGLLLAIVSYMDEHGSAFPSQRKISELTGQSVNTINKLINELLEIEIDGQKLLKREMNGGGYRKRSVYYIHNGEVSGADEIEKKKEKLKPMNSKDFVIYFMEVYEEELGQKYSVTWGKDLGLMKNKVMPNYSEETLKEVIETAVKKYREKWANDKFPLPTIPMLASWLANNAFEEIKREEKNEEEQQNRESKAVEQDESDKALESGLFD